MALWLTGDPAADTLLDADPLALLLGMLLDQQMTMEAAFAGPKKLADRMGGLDVRQIAATPPDDLAVICAAPPAIHRYPRNMAVRIQALARHLVDTYQGDPTRIWTLGDPDGATVLRRLKALPGFGEQKAQIFLALLGKQRGVTPKDWREAAGPFGDEGSHRSVADVTDKASLLAVRATKQQAKSAAKSAKG